jgi:hypothetical protein
MRRLTFGVLALVLTASCTVYGTARTRSAGGPPPEPPPRTVRNEPAPPPPPPAPEQHGWKLLAEAPVPSNKTALRLTFPPPGEQNPMTKMAIVVLGGEFHMNTTYLAYQNRTGGSISVDQVFKDGDRREVDLPKGRALTTFEFKYPSASVKGSPRVQIWGLEAN